MPKFTKGYWRHEKFMDVAFEIVYVHYESNKKAVITGFWWNLGYTGNPWCLFPDRSNITLTKDLDKWQRVYTLARYATHG